MSTTRFSLVFMGFIVLNAVFDHDDHVQFKVVLSREHQAELSKLIMFSIPPEKESGRRLKGLLPHDRRRIKFDPRRQPSRFTFRRSA